MTAPGRPERADTRPAGAYLHPGPVVVLSARVADWLLTRSNVDELRRQHRGADPEVDAQLLALTTAAHLHRATSARGSAGGSALDVAAEAPAPSDLVSTTRAADLLGIGTRAVRLAIAEHRLPARQVDGRWQITRTDLENYRGRRAV